MKKGEIFPINIPEKSTSESSTKPSKVRSDIKVRAPSDLKEGCIFTVKVKGKTVTALVPKGGVKKGEVFRIPYEEKEANT